MKKIGYLIVIVLIAVLTFTLCACSSFTGSQSDDEGLMFAVTFDTQGGSRIEQITVGDGSTLTLPSTPTKSGYIFDGWYLDDEFVEKFNETQTISTNITLYAKWRLPGNTEVYLSFDTDGGTSVNGFYANIGSTINLPSAPTKVGFDFSAWQYGEETYAQGAQFVVPNEDVTFTVIWLSQNLRYVTFETNGGSEVEKQMVESGSKMTAPKQPQRAGFLFAGWYKDSACTVLWNFGTDTVTESITLYAKWNIDVVGISSVEGASIDGTSIFMAVDNDVEYVELAEKVILSGNAYWNLYYDRIGQTRIPTKIAADRNTGVLNNKENVFYILVTSSDGLQEKLYTLTIYRRINITVEYYTIYNDLLETVEMENYNTISDAYDYDYELTGYTFVEWEFVNSNEERESFKFGANGTLVTNESILKLYTKATPNTYNVTLSVGAGETVSQTSVTATYDDPVHFPVPVKTGYSFVGWYYSSSKVSSETGYCSNWKYAKDVTLSPKFEINSYDVTISKNVDGCVVEGNGSYEYNAKVTISATTHMGYEWMGWYEGDTLLTQNQSYSFVMETVDRDFIAKWKVIDDYAQFKFTSTPSTITITGVNDNGITDITIPDSVTSIGEGAFRGCSGLTSITIPDSVTSIGYEAFRGCSGLTSITIPDSVTSIGSYAFEYCSALTSVTIGNGVKSIGSYVFDGCSNLTSIYYTGDITGWCGISGLGSIMSSSRTLYIGGKKVEGGLIIPDTVTSIGEGAFRSCSGLTSITIPNSVTSIGSFAFRDCSGLTTVNWNATACASAGSSYYPIFSGCTNLATVNIGNNVKTIPSYAFYECSRLTSITIPDSVTSIDSYAFYNCSGLTSITIPDSVTSIGSSAFRGCTGLTSIVFEDTTTWYRTTSRNNWINKTDGTQTSVINSSNNATYFTDTYSSYYWYKL